MVTEDYNLRAILMVSKREITGLIIPLITPTQWRLCIREYYIFLDVHPILQSTSSPRGPLFLSLSPTLQVDREAFTALTECIAEGDFGKCAQVPAGDEDGFLVNPLGGLAVDMAGPAG